MAAPILKGRALVRQRVLGLVFLVVLALLVGLTVALYQKRVHRRSTPSRCGPTASATSSPPAPTSSCAGLIVGEVREVRTTGDGAVLELALKPDMTGLIPRDVRARLLPKTLFGEKFVALVAPGRAQRRAAARRRRHRARTAARRRSRPSRSSTTSCRCCRRSSRSSCRPR